MFDKWLGRSRNKKRERRKPYYGCKAFDATCRNHGTDEWCLDNRLHANNKRLQAAEDKLNEAEKEI